MKKVLSLLLCLLFAVSVAGCGAFGNNKLELDRTAIHMTVGETAQLSAGKAVRVHWESSDEKVCSVIGGAVNAKSAGTAIVTASVESGEKASCTVTVDDKLIETITLSSKSLRLEPYKTIQLTASFTPADASKKALTWSSQDESVATVDEKGYVTGVSDGATIIICTSENGVEGSCAVTVSSDIMPTDPPYVPPTEAATEAPAESATEKEKEKKSKQKPAEEASGDFIFPDSSTRYLDSAEVSEKLAGMTGTPVAADFAQDAINEIYARHGFVFRSDYLREYYNSQSWYHADPSFSPNDLSEIELYNIGVINRSSP